MLTNRSSIGDPHEHGCDEARRAYCIRPNPRGDLGSAKREVHQREWQEAAAHREQSDKRPYVVAKVHDGVLPTSAPVPGHPGELSYQEPDLGDDHDLR